MKDEATPEQLAMARRIAAAELRNRNDWADLYRDAILRGDYDGSDGVRCALAAIIETTRLASSMAADTLDKARACEIDNDLRSIKHILVGRFVDDDHLKGQDHG